MKTRTLVSILFFILAVLIVVNSCATTPKTKEEREGVNQEVFFQSVRSGNYAEVKRLIKAGANVKTQDNDGFTVLILASVLGHAKITNLLIEAGADVNAQTSWGATALKWASDAGRTEVMKLLKEAGAK